MDPDHEVKLFEGIWEGGYFEGNPLDPRGLSNYYYQANSSPHFSPHAENRNEINMLMVICGISLTC